MRQMQGSGCDGAILQSTAGSSTDIPLTKSGNPAGVCRSWSVSTEPLRQPYASTMNPR